MTTPKATCGSCGKEHNPIGDCPHCTFKGQISVLPGYISPEYVAKLKRRLAALEFKCNKMREDMAARKVYLDNGRQLVCGKCGEVATGVCIHMVDKLMGDKTETEKMSEDLRRRAAEFYYEQDGLTWSVCDWIQTGIVTEDIDEDVVALSVEFEKVVKEAESKFVKRHKK